MAGARCGLGTAASNLCFLSDAAENSFPSLSNAGVATIELARCSARDWSTGVNSDGLSQYAAALNHAELANSREVSGGIRGHARA